MKRILFFFIKVVAVMVVLSQTTTSDTGFTLINDQINEPMALTLCGIGLLCLGLLGNKSKLRTM